MTILYPETLRDKFICWLMKTKLYKKDIVGLLNGRIVLFPYKKARREKSK